MPSPGRRGCKAATVRGIGLTLELGTRGAGERTTRWGGRRPGYPQTEPHHQTPGDVAISLNAMVVEQRRPTTPRVPGGILTFRRNTGNDSSSGELVTVAVPAAAQRAQAFQLRLDVPAAPGLACGLSIYGERMGAYPLDPTLTVEVAGKEDGTDAAASV